MRRTWENGLLTHRTNFYNYTLHFFIKKGGPVVESVHRLKIIRADALKTFLLFSNFYLIITAYYIAKPIRGALVVSELGAKSLPYIWIATAVLLAFFVGVYGKLIDRFSRKWLVTVTTLFFIASLLVIRYFLSFRLPWLTAVFYIWSDIFSVVMVEQFWSYTNDLFKIKDAKRFYALIGSGGILGGITGSALSAMLVKQFGTLNLVYICAGVLVLYLFFMLASESMVAADSKNDHTSEAPMDYKNRAAGNDLLASFRIVSGSPYAILILIMAVLTQVVSNLIDFQFNVTVESAGRSMDGKTAFFGNFFFWMNTISLVFMLLFTSPIQRNLGIFAALLVLPLFNCFGFALSLAVPLPLVIFGLKLFDKSLNYSINRASKELLYVPASRDIKYKAKAVIDMFIFRFSKILSSAVLIPVLAFFSWKAIQGFGLLLVGASVAVIFLISRHYSRLTTSPEIIPNICSSTD